MCSQLEYDPRNIEPPLNSQEKLNAIWKQDLSYIVRFSQEPMIHRSTVYEHVVRVMYLSEKVGQLMDFELNRNDIDITQLVHYAQIHDDPEVITGDIPSHHKSALTPSGKMQLHLAEKEAIQTLAKRYYKSQEQQKEYIHNWEEFTSMNSLEAQIVNIADKWDATCEVLTDIRYGNNTEAIFRILERYRTIFKSFQHKEVLEILSLIIPIEIPSDEDARNLPKIENNYFEESQQNLDTLTQKSLFPPTLPLFYDFWLQINNANALTIIPSWNK